MDYTDISILHTNDMHSYMENFPKKAQLIANIRARNEKEGVPTFVFDSGICFRAISFQYVPRGQGNRANESSWLSGYDLGQS